MTLILMIILGVLGIVFFVIWGEHWYGSDSKWGWLSLICLMNAFGLFIHGIINGFVSYPKSEGTHQGVITAIDQEGLIFNHYKVYLKSSGYTNQSDETEYCAYLDETELISGLKENIGKQVKLKYGHDGGYIGIKSCGTYHITGFDVVEEEK